MNTQHNSSWAAIFDLDGTMVPNSSYHRQAWGDLSAQYDLPFTPAMYYEKIHARSNDKIVANLFGPQADAAFVRRIQKEKEMFYQDAYRLVMNETPGLTALLTALQKAGIPCAAASNSPRTNVDFVLDGLNIRPFFSAVFCRDDVAVGKPNPEMLHKTAQTLGLPPQHCLVFEDSASGFKAARNAGMPYAAITGDTTPSELPEAHDAVFRQPDFTGLTVEKLSTLMSAS